MHVDTHACVADGAAPITSKGTQRKAFLRVLRQGVWRRPCRMHLAAKSAATRSTQTDKSTSLEAAQTQKRAVQRTASRLPPLRPWRPASPAACCQDAQKAAQKHISNPQTQSTRGSHSAKDACAPAAAASAAACIACISLRWPEVRLERWPAAASLCVIMVVTCSQIANELGCQTLACQQMHARQCPSRVAECSFSRCAVCR